MSEATCGKQPEDSVVTKFKWKVQSIFRTIFPRKSNTLKGAYKEFSILERIYPDKDNQHLAMEFKKEILALVDKFGKSGQSGGSAPYTSECISDVVKKLCMHQPISPITGEDSEWGDVSDNTQQNKRCSALFKDIPTGKVYYIDAIIWKETYEDGHTNCWGGCAELADGRTVSSACVSFPFVPKTFYIDVVNRDTRPGYSDFVVKDETQLDEVLKYYHSLKFWQETK